jgi:isoleucyl-tRNA synthetase
MNTDYWEDQRLGQTIIKTNIDAYRKLRNTIRWMLGTLAHDGGEASTHADMPELERLMLHRLWELDAAGRKGYDDFDFKRISRHAARFSWYRTVGVLFRHPQGCALLRCAVEPASQGFAAGDPEDLRLPGDLARADAALHHGGGLALSQSGRRLGASRTVPEVPGEWRDDALAAKWKKIRTVRRVVTGALEIERRKSASVRRWRPHPSSMSPIRRCARRSRISTWPRSASPRAISIRNR